MSLGNPAFSTGTFAKHLVARERKKKTRKRVLLSALSLTSMVDMFSLLVIFLLQTFSSSPEIMAIAKGVELPTAGSGLELKDAPVLALSAEGVFLDQKWVGKTDELLRDPEPLMEKLADQRNLWAASHPNEAFHGQISLQADRELSSVIVSQFMALLPSQHFGSIQLAVVGKGGAQ